MTSLDGLVGTGSRMFASDIDCEVEADATVSLGQERVLDGRQSLETPNGERCGVEVDSAAVPVPNGFLSPGDILRN